MRDLQTKYKFRKDLQHTSTRVTFLFPFPHVVFVVVYASLTVLNAMFSRHIGHVGWDPNTGFDVSTQQ